MPSNNLSISVADILAKRAPNRHIPQFVVRYIERLIHQDEINDGLAQYGHLRNYDFIEAVVRQFLHCDYTLHENYPIFRHNATDHSLSRPIFVSNHPLGGLDGMILALMLHEHGYDVKMIVNDLLTNIEPIRDLCVPVNKIGAQRREYAQRMHDLLAGDSPILTFPAGACSRLIDGEVKDLPWHNSYLKHAERYHRDIVPIYFDGRNSMHFYRVAQWRKWLHIPFNCEMLLLPDEMFRARGHHYNIYITQPITYNL